MKKRIKNIENREPIVDGWGLIIIIIGFALIFLGDVQGLRNAGILILIIGIIRVLLS